MVVSYNWLKEYIGDALPEPQAVADLLTFHSFEIDGVEQVRDDTIIDVDVLPNRSSDCLCHRGIAREIATLLNIELAHDPLATPPELKETDAITVTIEDQAACPRFTASLIEGVEVKESPDWLKARLEAIGQRPINNIVDATNYVMYAIGQPLHAYDADLFPQVDGAWQFQVRYAREGEQVSLIPEGGKTEDRVVECLGTELLIVDKSSDTPIGLAGIKGGRFAGVHADTKNIIIEAAHFDPIITRQTARRLGIVIDASKRFENEPSRELPPYAQRDIIALIADIAGGSDGGAIDTYLETKTNAPVTVRVATTNALLGLELSTEEVADILKRTGSTVETDADAEVLTVTGPWERSDLHIEEDFIEEVGRIHGLDNIESVVPEAVALPEVNARQYYTDVIRDELTKLGYSEVITSSFHKKGKIQLRNALASDKSYVRSDLHKNLTHVLDQNFVHVDLLGLEAIKVFEIGTVFTKTEDDITEHVALALGVRQKGSGYTPKDDAVLEAAKAVVTEVLGAAPNWQNEKGVVECNLTELIVNKSASETFVPVQQPDARFSPISPYPAMSRDIALWVTEGTEAAMVELTLEKAAGELCVRITQFDEFTKDGRTSYAFRLVFQSHEKTLTDESVNAIMDQVYAAVAEKGWEVR